VSRPPGARPRAAPPRRGAPPPPGGVPRPGAHAAALALLRRQARHAGPGGDPGFAERERELLRRLWLRRGTAAPALARAAVLEELLPVRPGPPAAAPARHARRALPVAVPAPRRAELSAAPV
ncbi:PrsW family intramembrane metalloprotease, partial [Streptomyces sp. NPDC127112]